MQGERGGANSGALSFWERLQRRTGGEGKEGNSVRFWGSVK